VPNKPQTRKRVRQNEKRRAHNRQLRSSMRTAVKKVNNSIEEKQAETLDSTLKEAQSKLGKAAKVGLIKKNTMARTQSRLMKKAAAVKKAAQ
jgi:small subunit ribosomal protein S20